MSTDDAEAKYDDPPVHDVIIIGAGYSGLSAGLYFQDCNVNNFVVLEARERVGGRVCTEYVRLDDGRTCYVDAGGAYVGPLQNRLLRLCNRFGIKTFHVNIKGKSTMDDNGNVGQYSGTIPTHCGIFTLLDLNHALRETDKLAAPINTVDIQKSEMSQQTLKKYDNMTVQQWIEQTISDRSAQQQYQAAFRSVHCVEASEVSLLFWLNYVKNAKDVMHLIETKNGAQDSKVVGGTQGLCECIMKQLNEDRERVKLKHVVQRIEHDQDIVSVYCKNGAVYKSKYVLCCIAPALYKRIEWKPALSWDRQHIANRMPMGFILKTNTYFKTAWWRDAGLNGFSFTTSDDDKYANPVVTTFDDCKPDGSFPSLMGFILADQARKYMAMSHEERKQCVLKQYARVFKSDKAMTECIGYFEKAWHEEEFSGGCYCGTTGCNVMSSSYWKVLKQSENEKIYFGGTELADYWMGYMDGAIQAGEREANKIASILAKQDEGIKVKKIYDGDKEPEQENCPLSYVSLDRSWIEQHVLPSAKSTKLGLFLLTVVALIVAVYLKVQR